MGDSAGGNLAAVSTLVGIDRQMAFAKDLQSVGLVYAATCIGCPNVSKIKHKKVIDNDKMTWFTMMYLRSPIDAFDWRASPMFAPQALLAKMPHTYSVLMHRDPLYDEAFAFHKRVLRAKKQTHKNGDGDSNATAEVEVGVFAGFHGLYGTNVAPSGDESVAWLVSKLKAHTDRHAREWETRHTTQTCDVSGGDRCPATTES
eukprot:GDKI01024984.1.p1 GENE.GDKI01024984.1~~GDKI01024984.1.p1  ORF type:complete len:219 (-),score=71.52 GDKI01024984.1:435-1040(-)